MVGAVGAIFALSAGADETVGMGSGCIATCDSFGAVSFTGVVGASEEVVGLDMLLDSLSLL